jgi:hypothetical protein
MDSSAVYSRTGDSWRLSFVHACKLLHYLTRALLLSVASASLGLAWFCCWIDRFRSSRDSTAWLIHPDPNPNNSAARAPDTYEPAARANEAYAPAAGSRETALPHEPAASKNWRQQRPVEVAARPYLQPRTIDSLIRSKAPRGSNFSSQQN